MTRLRHERSNGRAQQRRPRVGPRDRGLSQDRHPPGEAESQRTYRDAFADGVRARAGNRVSSETEVGMRIERRGATLKQVAAVTTAVFVVLGPVAPAGAHTRDKVRTQRSHIRERARTQVGARYSYGGTSPNGFDCSGYTRWTFQEHGASLPHSSMDQFELGRRRGYRRIWKRRDLRIGDLVFHKTTSARVGHAGIYIGRGKFISSTSSDGVRVRSLYDPYYWGSRFVAGTRVPAMIKDR